MQSTLQSIPHKIFQQIHYLIEKLIKQPGFKVTSTMSLLQAE